MHLNNLSQVAILKGSLVSGALCSDVSPEPIISVQGGADIRQDEWQRQLKFCCQQSVEGW